MKILIGDQIKTADQYTIKHEPISSLHLMERASLIMSEWIEKNIPKTKRLFFLIGKGNNGGDGLAMARILAQKGFECSVFLAFEKQEFTIETRFNFQQLATEICCQSLQNILPNDIIIDCLLGTGVKGEVKDFLWNIIKHINSLPNKIIAIDIPSGMHCEWENNPSHIIQANITLTLEFPKLAMLLPEAGECCGEVVILPIRLSKKYIQSVETPYFFIEKEDIKSWVDYRKKFSYKNKYGHSLLICGSETMQGAALLATSAALRSGSGLVTAHIPYDSRHTIISHCPSAMLSLDNKNYCSSLPKDIEKYTAIGIGCGLGKATETIQVFELLLDTFKKPIVIDADALNILANNKNLLKKIPSFSILTPHLGELKRLVGEWHSEKEKIDWVCQLSETYKIIVIVKGAYTMIVCPNQQIYFNSTGNSGMAKGGSGDILTGLITGLLSRGYDSIKASLIGVYLHGLAGDNAAEKIGKEPMNSHDIITYLPEAFKTISHDI